MVLDIQVLHVLLQLVQVLVLEEVLVDGASPAHSAVDWKGENTFNYFDRNS